MEVRVDPQARPETAPCRTARRPGARRRPPAPADRPSRRRRPRTRRRAAPRGRRETRRAPARAAGRPPGTSSTSRSRSSRRTARAARPRASTPPARASRRPARTSSTRADRAAVQVDHRVPDLRAPVVGRPPDRADVDDPRAVHDAALHGMPVCVHSSSSAPLASTRSASSSSASDSHRKSLIASGEPWTMCTSTPPQLARAARRAAARHPGRERRARVRPRVVVHELGEGLSRGSA